MLSPFQMRVLMEMCEHFLTLCGDEADLITQACTDFDVCIKLTVFEQFRPPDYENDFGFALSRLVFSQIVFS
jgi:hypothetical protein